MTTTISAAYYKYTLELVAHCERVTAFIAIKAGYPVVSMNIVLDYITELFNLCNDVHATPETELPKAERDLFMENCQRTLRHISCLLVAITNPPDVKCVENIRKILVGVATGLNPAAPSTQVGLAIPVV